VDQLGFAQQIVLQLLMLLLLEAAEAVAVQTDQQTMVVEEQDNFLEEF
jgi:hypothetical protein